MLKIRTFPLRAARMLAAYMLRCLSKRTIPYRRLCPRPLWVDHQDTYASEGQGMGQ